MKVRAKGELELRESQYFSPYLRLNVKFREEGKYFWKKSSICILDSDSCKTREEFYDKIVDTSEDIDYLKDAIKYCVERKYDEDNKMKAKKSNKAKALEAIKGKKIEITIDIEKGE